MALSTTSPASLGLTRLKRYLPNSLLWRTVLIVVLPMVLLQAVVAALIIERHFDGVSRQMSESAATSLSRLVEIVDAAETPEEAVVNLRAAAPALGYLVRLDHSGVLPPRANPLFFDVIAVAVEQTFRERLPRASFIAINRHSKRVDVRTVTRHGVLRATIPQRRVIAANAHLLLTWMAAAALALVTIALVYLRNQIRPIQALAKAADAFGKGRHIPIRIAGADEVRMAASAFVDARTRIDRFMEQRTRMLSGVSHDLRTPLTRIRLSLEMMEGGGRVSEQEVAEMRNDVAQMAHIIDEFLAYARGDQGETFEPTDIAELAREIVTEARRAGREMSLFEQIAAPDDTSFSLRRHAIKRCVHNLIDNAAKHGETIQITLSVTRTRAEIVIEDDGPGIAKEDRESAIKPFHRLDQARNQNRSPEGAGSASGGNVGLGLALAVDTARGHGGDLRLGRSARLGGLKATVSLPR